MDRDIEDVARRLEARAFLYGDPGSYREGVAEALRAVAAARSGTRRIGAADRRPGADRTDRPAAASR